MELVILHPISNYPADRRNRLKAFVTENTSVDALIN
jgi:hypothetical protein